MTTNEIVKLAVKVMEDKKGTEIKVIDISRVSVIAEMPDVPQSSVLCVVFQIFFLVQNTVRLALLFIISGQPFIECCNLIIAIGQLSSFPAYSVSQQKNKVESTCFSKQPL